MNKSQLIDLIASTCDVSKRQAGDVLNCIIDGITNAVCKGDKVAISGLGSFERVDRAARDGRNPATGETIRIAASKACRFKIAKPFKDAVKASK
jgi:DNA-binding protein HU-beta